MCSKVNLLRVLLDVFVEPCNSLVKGLFLCPLSPWQLWVSPDSKAVLYIRKQVNLPWDVFLKEDGLSFLPFLWWENGISLCRRKLAMSASNLA
jgi:hypothetical protein